MSPSSKQSMPSKSKLRRHTLCASTRQCCYLFRQRCVAPKPCSPVPQCPGLWAVSWEKFHLFPGLRIPAAAVSSGSSVMPLNDSMCIALCCCVFQAKIWMVSCSVLHLALIREVGIFLLYFICRALRRWMTSSASTSSDWKTTCGCTVMVQPHDRESRQLEITRWSGNAYSCLTERLKGGSRWN